MSGSYGLISVGRGVKRDAMQGMEKVALQERGRELRNGQIAAAEKQQKSTNMGAGGDIGMMAAKGTAVGGALKCSNRCACRAGSRCTFLGAGNVWIE
ncbi:hypothetical protein [Microbulbifer epialgicus]|uniref:Uncharacterized protein n=1 Tax=Microbulbifer epialgicus TaxID=393907 RepID=A0ABV4P5I8_9GAMM